MPTRPRVLVSAFVLVSALSIGAGCSRSDGGTETGPDTVAKRCTPDGMPCTDPSAGGKAVGKTGKVIWAESRLYFDAPPLDVQTWLKGKPELEGKFVLVEFWRTWCGACKKTVPLLNSFQEKYGKELVVIGITGEPEETVRAYAGPAMDYAVAIDRPGTRRHQGSGRHRGAARRLGLAACGPARTRASLRGVGGLPPARRP